VHGNVWEWTSSLYKPYPYDAGDGREYLTAGDFRVLRGGSWFNDASLCRSASRGRLVPGNRDYYLGFRVARTVE